MARPRSELRVRAAVVRARREQLHLGQKELGVSDRTYRAWLDGAPISEEKAECLARHLGLGIAEIVDGLPADYVIEAAEEEDDLSRRAIRLRDRAVRGALIHEAGKFRTYLRHIGLRFMPLRGFVRHFRHLGTEHHFYAEVVLHPAVPDASAVFTFSFKLGPLRIDYGEICVDATHARLVTHFAASGEPLARRHADGSIRVWTWFGKEACDFLVRSRHEFTLESNVRPAERDPDHRPDDVLCFRAAPHHQHKKK